MADRRLMRDRARRFWERRRLMDADGLRSNHIEGTEFPR